MANTNSEGLAGFIAYKTTTIPTIQNGEFVFETVTETELEKIESEFIGGGFSQVQQMVVLCGKKRRKARSSNHSKKG